MSFISISETVEMTETAEKAQNVQKPNQNLDSINIDSSDFINDIELRIIELCKNGDYYELTEVLKELEDQQIIVEFKKPVFCIIGMKLQTTPHSIIQNYKKCFAALLNYSYITVECINQVERSGWTALHYAIQFKFDDLTLELLRRGAYVGVLNSANEIAIQYIEPELFETYLDWCIEMHEIDTPDYNITIDYKVFSCTSLPHDNFYFRYANPISVLKCISKSDKLNHLVNHPTLHHMVKSMWNDMMTFMLFNITLAILLLFLGCFLTLCNYSEDELIKNSILGLLKFSRISSYVVLVCIILRELLEFFVSKGACRSEYIYSLMNMFELSFIVILSIILFCDLSKQNSLKRTLVAIEILLTAVEFNYVCKLFPIASISEYVNMFRVVTINVFKLLMIYLSYICAFGYALFILFRKPNTSSSETRMNMTAINGTIAMQEDFHTFGNIISSFMKTLVMFVGELDYDSIKLHRHQLSYFILILFIFFITTVLTNLVNGLAITDIQEIVQNAKKNRIIYCIKILERNDRHLKLKFIQLLVALSSHIEACVCAPVQWLLKLRQSHIKNAMQFSIINQIKIFPHANKTKMKIVRVLSKNTFKDDEVIMDRINENILNSCLDIIEKNDERKRAMRGDEENEKVVNILSDVLSLNSQVKEIVQELKRLTPDDI